jgi:hypothetical protein
MSESSGDNIDEAKADELLLQWKREVVPEELKELKGLLTQCCEPT